MPCQLCTVGKVAIRLETTQLEQLRSVFLGPHAVSAQCNKLRSSPYKEVFTTRRSTVGLPMAKVYTVVFYEAAIVRSETGKPATSPNRVSGPNCPVLLLSPLSLPGTPASSITAKGCGCWDSPAMPENRPCGPESDLVGKAPGALLKLAKTVHLRTSSARGLPPLLPHCSWSCKATDFYCPGAILPRS